MKFPTDVTEIDAIEDGNWLLVADASDNDASRKISIQNMFGGYDLFKYGMKYIALNYLKSLNPVALWVPGMQTDGFREENGVTYLTQLTDLSGNGNHAVQDTATAQAYLDGSDAVFSGAQCYENSSTFDVSSGFTGIIRWNSTQTEHFRLINTRGTGAPGTYKGFQISPTGSSFSNTFLDNGTNSISISVSYDKTITQNTLLDFDPTTGRSYLSSNDNNTYVINTDLIESDLSQTPFVIGTSANYAGQWYIGDMSVAALYSKTLTTIEKSIVNQCLNILGA
jgi:hypothetical protein